VCGGYAPVVDASAREPKKGVASCEKPGVGACDL